VGAPSTGGMSSLTVTGQEQASIMFEISGMEFI